MTAIDDIKSGLDLDQVASLLGTDPATADAALDDALGSLLGAMGGNAAGDDGALGLARAALRDHDNDLLEGGVDLGAVDAEDGSAILSHLYSPEQIQTLSSGSGGMLDKLLPILAPIVMAYLAKKLNGYLGGGAPQQQQGGGGFLDDLLGSVLGGGRAAPQPQQPTQGAGGGILDDLLGSIFGQQAASEPAAPTPRTQAPAPRTQTPAPSFPDAGGGLRMDDGSGDAAAPQGGGAQVPQLPGGGLGDLLRQILVGR